MTGFSAVHVRESSWGNRVGTARPHHPTNPSSACSSYLRAKLTRVQPSQHHEAYSTPDPASRDWVWAWVVPLDGLTCISREFRVADFGHDIGSTSSSIVQPRCGIASPRRFFFPGLAPAVAYPRLSAASIIWNPFPALEAGTHWSTTLHALGRRSPEL